MNLKSLLKAIKLNESTISMALGVFVILAIVVLVFNYFRGQKANTEQLPPAASTENTVASNEHVVTKGDTLWSIAEDYYKDGYKWTDIAKANNLTDPGQITVGEKLVIPDASGEGQVAMQPIASLEPSPSVVPTATPEESPTPTPIPTIEATVAPTESPAPTETPAPVAEVPAAPVTPAQPSSETITGDTYTVVHGDNLWTIAVRAYGDGYKWTEIAKANNLVHPSLIHSGNVFHLPR